MADMFFSIFGHHPRWIKLTLVWHNRIAKWCGLSVLTAAEVMNSYQRSSYSLGQNELVAGRDNTHLDFRLSIQRELDGPSSSVLVSTVCVVRNLSGKVYFFFIVLFHRWGVKYVSTSPLRAGRL